jgi:hypothetical protein
LFDSCIYPQFKENPADITINLGFFKDNAAHILPLASFNTDSMALVSDQNISFMQVVYDQKFYTSKLIFNLKNINKTGSYNVNVTLKNI